MDNKITLIDGAMGTEIRARGFEVPSHINSIWSAQALIDNPEVVRDIHEDYIPVSYTHLTLPTTPYV